MWNKRGRRPKSALTGGIIAAAAVAVAAGGAGASAAPVQTGGGGTQVLTAAVPPLGVTLPVTPAFAATVRDAETSRSGTLERKAVHRRPSAASSRRRTRTAAPGRRSTPAHAARAVHPVRRATAARAQRAAAHPPRRPAPPKPRPAVHAATAATPGISYGQGSMGFDVSQYQCGQFVPRAPIAIVQVSNGSLNKGPNPCFRQEAAWAGPEASDYIFMDAYPGGASAIEMKGPAAYCAAHNVGCRAFDYGAYWAMYWLGYARTQGLASRQWWLDVENTGSWAGTSVNQATISGARYLLRSQHVGVGIYSTRTQWRSIAGTMTFPGVDLWVPGAGNVSGRGYSATSLCQKWPSETFAGGHLEMVQWGYRGSFPGAYSGGSPFDLDYAC